MGLEALAFGGGLTALTYGQFMAAEAAEEEAEFAQAQADYNAAQLDLQAKDIEARTDLAQKKAAEQAERIKSTLEAELGAGGAVMTMGAPLLAQAKQESDLELKTLFIGYEGEEAAKMTRKKAELERVAGKAAKRRGKARKLGYLAEAGATLLTGFSTAAERGYIG